MGTADRLRMSTFVPTSLGEYIRQLHDGGSRHFVTFLIGAGFSKSAGIPLAGEIVQELRGEANTHPFLRSAGVKPDGISEYAFLMEQLGSPKERANRVKKYVDRAKDDQGRLKINWSHLLLAALVEKGYVNRLLTTNFDPLIVEALAVTGQPIRTYDLNTTGKYSPGTLDPASIIYLHGQMHSLFLANSPDEMARLRGLYPKVLQEAVQDSILIIVGYSGECDPVLDSLAELPNFPRGLWWSHYSRSGSQYGPGVGTLFKQHGSDCHFSSGDDSDTFMRKLVLDGMKLDLPDEVLKPLTAIRLALERITPFPKDGIQGSDPVQGALEMLRRAEQLVETPQIKRGPTVASQAPDPTLDELAKVMPIEMAALAGSWAEFDRLSVSVQPNPESRLSKSVGDGLLRQASVRNSENNPSAALSLIGEVTKFGLTEPMSSWLPVIWGNALMAQARLKANMAEAEALLVEAGKKFAEAIRIKLDMPEAFSNWGAALSDQAELRGNTAEADALFVEAGKKFAEAVRIKPDMHDALFNWGSALMAQAELKGNTTEANTLFIEAGKKFAEAVRIRPDKHEAFSNWGAVLLAQAKLGVNLGDADALLVEAGNKFAEAVRIRPDKHEAFSNWGAALSDQAKLKGNTTEADALFLEAGNKFAEAVRIKPEKHEAFFNWGAALLAQGKLKGNSEEADALFLEAGKKYAEAVRIKPDMAEALFSWGTALLDQAELKENTAEADALFLEAGKKYAEAVRIKPGMHEAFFNWGTALLAQAELKGNTTEANTLFIEAGKKFAEAVRIKPDMCEAFFNWGTALMAQAKLEENTVEAETLLQEAEKKYAEVVRVRPGDSEAQFNLACLAALTRNVDKVLANLEKWKAADPSPKRASLDEDSDFDLVRNNPEFIHFRSKLPV